VRRQTFAILVVLFVILLAAAIAQVVIATRDTPPLPGPTSPGQLPSLGATPS
jgi:hypothetical protein